MSIKKKMSMGILAGALGVSLIGGGTWAAFNDVEEVNNTFAAGTLDLVVGEATTMDFNISNLKPGDYFTKTLVLGNNGSLPINQIKFHAKKNTDTPFVDKDEIDLASKIGADAGKNNEDDFLGQFNIKIENSSGDILYDGLLSGLFTDGVEELTGTTDSDIGLAVGGSESFNVTVKFNENSNTFNGSRLMQQNKYQGEGTDMKFVFEATQMKGEDRSTNN